MNDEPVLVFRPSRPDHFKCSYCDDVPADGRFSTDTSTQRLLSDFREHVLAYHSSKTADTPR